MGASERNPNVPGRQSRTTPRSIPPPRASAAPSKHDRRDQKPLGERLRDDCSECAGDLIESCLAFVVRTAAEFRGFGVPFEDLVNEGNVGLLEAARRFDASRGTKFITYARWWIRKSILLALDEQARVVRVPSYQIKKSRTIREIEGSLERQLGRAPSAAEVADRLDVRLSRSGRAGPLRYREISLDHRPAGPSRRSFVDTLRDDARPDPEKSLILKQALCLVLDAWTLLTDQERRILSRRFGLTGEPSLTLKAIGQTMNLSHERVRQIEERAIARIRRAFDASGRHGPGGRAPRRR